MQPFFEEALAQLQQLFGRRLKLRQTQVEAVVQVILLVGDAAILLREQVQKGVLFLPAEVVAIPAALLKGDALELAGGIDGLRGLLEFVINGSADSLLDILHHFLKLPLDLVENLGDLLLPIGFLDESSVFDEVEFSLDVVVDFVVGADGALQKLLLVLSVRFYDPQHLGAGCIKLGVPLHFIRSHSGLQQFVGHAPQQERHLLFHKILDDVGNLIVELQELEAVGLVGRSAAAHLLQQFGVLELQRTVEGQVSDLRVLSAASREAVPVVLAFEPAFHAENSLLL
jgi:hypothetical protein